MTIRELLINTIESIVGETIKDHDGVECVFDEETNEFFVYIDTNRIEDNERVHKELKSLLDEPWWTHEHDTNGEYVVAYTGIE